MFLEMKQTALTQLDCTTVKDMHTNVQWCIQELQGLRSGKGKGSNSSPGEVGGETSQQGPRSNNNTNNTVDGGSGWTWDQSNETGYDYGTDQGWYGNLFKDMIKSLAEAGCLKGSGQGFFRIVGSWRVKRGSTSIK